MLVQTQFTLEEWKRLVEVVNSTLEENKGREEGRITVGIDTEIELRGEVRESSWEGKGRVSVWNEENGTMGEEKITLYGVDVYST